MRRAPQGARRREADPLGLGGAPPRPRRARLRRSPRPHRDHAARDQSRARCRGGRARAPDPERVRPPRRGHARRARRRDRQREHADRRGRAPGRVARDRQPLDGAAVPARRGERRRDAPAPLPLARPAARQAPAQHRAARADGRDHPARDGGRRLPRHPDADPVQADARGRARLHRSGAAPEGPLLRAAAEPAAAQAADDGRGLRPLLPDRDLLPGRGSPCRPRPGADPARRRDELPRPGAPLRRDGAHVRADLARVPRDRDRDAVPADDLRGGRPPLRHRQARHPLRARDRGRDGGDARLAVRRLRRRGRGALPARPAGAQPRRSREARGAGQGVGGEGARLPRLRRGGRGALADREVPLGGGAGRVPRRARRRPSSSPPTPGPRPHACSARCGATSARSSA